ncbi:FliA/WhiG family RNA polymerase sigma factor [Aquibacillus kalidii]|uniref:FliA/WhiG family RNA polymerase sigma factor n=1 Tax=Aquibacillus kalidii TaxID=2762597 RepID=UPI00164581E1|nr:FliA/WhiG family RNA polymerase sigma factor [Aquibacillus kalidii]
MINQASIKNDLWENWINQRDNDNANKLIENYTYLVNYHVQRIGIHLPKNVSKDDIKSLGLFGLYDALLKFDYSRDLKFETYASFRIRGAIIDGLRKEDWLPRSSRDKAKKVERESHRLEQQLHRSPTSEEIAKELQWSSSEVEEVIKDNLFANLLSIEENSNDNGDEFKDGIGYSIPDDKTPLPEQFLKTKEDHLELEQAIRNLNENEQIILSLFYHEELTFTEIGKVLELTTSRISQIHKQAIFKLKSSLTQVH